MTDIPLRDVQVIWDYHGDDPEAPPLKLMGHPNESGRDSHGRRDDREYFSSWGSCNSEFNETDDAGRLLKLFQQYHQIVTLDRIDPEYVHEAFLVIPEYRKNIAIDLVPAKYLDEDGRP